MTDADPSRFCKQCDYPLGDGVVLRCPECGRGFDAGDAKTYSGRPTARRRRWMRRGWMALGVVVLLEAFAPSRVARVTWAWPNADGVTATWETRWCLVGPRWLGVKYPKWSTARGQKGIEPRGLVYCECQMWSVGWFGVERGMMASLNVPGTIADNGTVRSSQGYDIAPAGKEMYFDVGPGNLDRCCDELLDSMSEDAPAIPMLPMRNKPARE